jgi:hypothetical protein
MEDNMIKSLRRRVEDADCAHRQAQIRASMACLHIHNECDGSFTQSEAEGKDERETADVQQQKHASASVLCHAKVATEHSIIAQNNQLQLQLEASFRRTKLLERRLQERQVSTASKSLSVHVCQGSPCDNLPKTEQSLSRRGVQLMVEHAGIPSIVA